MSSPRDRDPDDGSEWREPTHLGGDDATEEDRPNFADRRLTPRESFAEGKELVEGKARPFTTSELRVAETLRATVEAATRPR